MPSSAQFYNDVYNGNVFVGTTAAAGVVIPATNATAITYAIWNPLGSNRNIVPLYTNIGFVSTTAAPSNLGLSYQTGMGAQVATGAPVTAATLVAPVNTMLSAGNSSVAKFAPATLTLATAATYLMTFGMSQTTTTGATTSSPGWTFSYAYQGQIIVPPGVGIFVTSANTSELSVVDISCVWAETPLSG